MATDIDTFDPLYPEETEAAIRARWDEWANEGLSLEQVEEWTDTRVGSFFYVATMPGVREFARAYDLMGSEVVQAAIATRAWGSYLDDHAEVRDLERTAAQFASGTVTFTGVEGDVIPAGTRVGVAPPTPDAPAPEYEVLATVTIPDEATTVDAQVRAIEAGVAGNVSAGAVTLVLTPGLGVSVTNAEKISGGTEAETDESLRERLLDAYRGQGPGNVADYVRWTRAYLGGGRVTVIPLANGPGTVTVIALDANGDPLQQDVIDGLQAFLDPVAGKGAGDAPIGASVTVGTATPTSVALAAAIEFEAGYSLDGAGGTLALRDVIVAALEEYVESVPPGGEIILAKVIGIIAGTTGVYDVSNVLLNGEAENVAVAADPAEVPVLDTPTLTEA